MADTKNIQKKARILRSRGVLKDTRRSLRIMLAAGLVLACASLTFTQLGFAGIGFGGKYFAYAVVLLLPISLAALLLGTLSGTCIGILAGAILLIHAKTIPLDYYEMSFITPLTSVIMLGVCGFLLSILFAFVLRHDPSSRVKRGIYIFIVCLIVSFLYSIGFVVNVVIEMASNLVESGAADLSSQELESVMQTKLIVTAVRLGDVGLQILVDALLMTACGIVSDIVAHRLMSAADNATLRGKFAVWLTVVVLVAFMITAGVSFAAISQGRVTDASEDIKSEVNYLCGQLSDESERIDALQGLLEDEGVDIATLSGSSTEKLLKVAFSDNLLNGYTPEVDGTLFILERIVSEEDTTVSDEDKFVIVISDDERFEAGSTVKEAAGTDVAKAVISSAQTGEVLRVIYDGNAKRFEDNHIILEEDGIDSEIVYVYAQPINNRLVVNIYPAKKVFAGRGATMGWITVSVIILLAVVFLMVFQLLNRVVVRRIDETNAVLGLITDGDLDARVEAHDTKEFKSLSGGINTTVDALKGWIAEAESRMDAELATAKAIQESALPRTFPPFPDILRFDIYASMKPAREVGGDFYDFFLIGSDCTPDQGKLGFVVADVSGKGVPAALFMMKAMTQLRDYLQSGMEVGEAVENANRMLCEGNDAGMFVTAWVGVLDYATMRVEFANAGHNPPLLWQKDGGWRWVTEKSGLPLGLFDGLPYEPYSIQCGIGDQFLVYSDGVTEAMNKDGELYGEQRLEDVANSHYARHPRSLLAAVRRDLLHHVQGADQSDDITMLALEVGVPPELTATIVVPADVDELPYVNAFIHTELDRRLCPKRAQNQLDIAVEELFVNVAHYAYPEATPEKPGMVRVSYTYTADPPSVCVDIADDGIPYNPLAKPDAVTPDKIEDVPIGGLGILMAKRSVDNMTYERTDGSNIVSITKSW